MIIISMWCDDSIVECKKNLKIKKTKKKYIEVLCMCFGQVCFICYVVEFECLTNDINMHCYLNTFFN